jgi:hypothetical protein
VCVRLAVVLGRWLLVYPCTFLQSRPRAC